MIREQGLVLEIAAGERGRFERRPEFVVLIDPVVAGPRQAAQHPSILRHGRFAMDELLKIVFSALGMESPDFSTDLLTTGGDETLKLYINLKASVDLAKLISSDLDLITQSVIADIHVGFMVVETNTGVIHNRQDILK